MSDEALERIEAKLDGIEGKLDDLETSVGRVEASLADLEAGIIHLHREDLRDDPEARDRLGVEPAELRP